MVRVRLNAVELRGKKRGESIMIHDKDQIEPKLRLRLRGALGVEIWN